MIDGGAQNQKIGAELGDRKNVTAHVQGHPNVGRITTRLRIGDAHGSQSGPLTDPSGKGKVRTRHPLIVSSACRNPASWADVLTPLAISCGSSKTHRQSLLSSPKSMGQ